MEIAKSMAHVGSKSMPIDSYSGRQTDSKTHHIQRKKLDTARILNFVTLNSFVKKVFLM
jgi:hypothetical protein